MTAQPFDSGRVLERASPVLTFSTEARVSRPPAGAPRGRADTPTPVPVTRSNLQSQRSLPVIPRIVRRTIVDGDALLLRAAARAAGVARAARKSVVGSMAIAGIVLAALGASAGVALRSLSDPSQVALHISEARVSEPPLARASTLSRVEGTPSSAGSRSVPAESASAGTDHERTVASPTAFRARPGEPTHKSSPVGREHSTVGREAAHSSVGREAAHSAAPRASPHHRGVHPTSTRAPTRPAPTIKPKPQ